MKGCNVKDEEGGVKDRGRGCERQGEGGVKDRGKGM